MSSVIISKTFPAPPFCEKEILRYAGCKEPDDEISALLRECISEAKDRLVYKICYRELEGATAGNFCRYGDVCLQSEKLAARLKGCRKVIVFAATVGVGIDRLITRHGRFSPAKALLLQAIGTERVEALCDAFCAELEKEYRAAVKPRFSPGYGDLSLECQREIFSILDCERKIGLTLNRSLLMSPSKSVTAFVGLDEKQSENVYHDQRVFRGVE